MHAASNNVIYMVRMLLDAQADVNAKCNQGKTALTIAKEYKYNCWEPEGSAAIVELLTIANLNIDERIEYKKKKFTGLSFPLASDYEKLSLREFVHEVFYGIDKYGDGLQKYDECVRINDLSSAIKYNTSLVSMLASRKEVAVLSKPQTWKSSDIQRLIHLADAEWLTVEEFLSFAAALMMPAADVEHPAVQVLMEDHAAALMMLVGRTTSKPVLLKEPPACNNACGTKDSASTKTAVAITTNASDGGCECDACVASFAATGTKIKGCDCGGYGQCSGYCSACATFCAESERLQDEAAAEVKEDES